MGKYFGTDGIRRKSSEFDSDFLTKIALAITKELKSNKQEKNKILIGGDTRYSSESIIDIMTEALLENSIDVCRVGIIPTPAISFLTKEYKADMSIMISASHNPEEDNGIKVLNNKGLKLTDDTIKRLEEIIDNPVFPDKINAPRGEGEYCHDEAIEKYINHLITSTKENLSSLNILVDCANGATSVIAKELFMHLGASAKLINSLGFFGAPINKDCGSTHLERIITDLDNTFDFGVAFDGDGDRALFVAKDESGNIQKIDGDHIIAIIADDLKKEGKLNNNMIATTVMANLGLSNWARDNGIEVVTTDVGDTNVKEAMDKYNISVGGEQSGHIILEGQSTGDGILTALTIASIVKKTNKSLVELASIITKTPQKHEDFTATEEEKKLISSPELTSYVASINKDLALQGAKINLRASGTEPVIRLTVWANTEEEITEILADMVSFLYKYLSPAKQLTIKP